MACWTLLHLTGPGPVHCSSALSPFLDGYGISPLRSQEGGEGDCGLCHSCHLKARASKGQKPRFLFLPALRRQDCGKEGKSRSAQHPFCWQLEAI